MVRFHPAARRALADLAKAGVVLDPADDFHHLVRLDELARAAAGISNDWLTQAVMFPARGVGGVTLRRLSHGARRFMFEEAVTWFDVDGEEWVIALAFAMALSMRPRSLWRFVGNRDGFVEAASEWGKGVGATPAALAATVKLLLDDGPAPVLPPLTDGASDMGAIAEALASEFGHTPEYWFWDATEADFALVLAKRNARIERECKAISASGGSVRAPDPDSTWVRARVALRAYQEEIFREKQSAATSPREAGSAGTGAPDATTRTARTGRAT